MKVIFVIISLLTLPCVKTKNSSDFEKSDEFGYREVLWFIDLPNLSKMLLQSEFVQNESCRKQLFLYDRDLKNGTLWAVEMYDASVKFPDGILEGHTRHFGNFDQCYRLQVNLTNPEENNQIKINTRYCLIDIEYYLKSKFNSQNEKFTLEFDPTQSVWESVVEKNDWRRYKRYKLQLAICIPAACNSNHLETALEIPLLEFGKKSNLNVRVKVDPENCQSRLEETHFPLDAQLFCALLFFLVLMVVGGTICHMQCKNEDSGSKIVNFCLLFSLQRNSESIFKPYFYNNGLDFVHFTKIIYTTLFLWGHRALLDCHSNPVSSGLHYEKTFESPWVLGHMGTLLVDSFLSLGGLLLSYSLLQELEKGRKFNLISFVFLRFFRIAPLYLFIIFFNATLFPYTGTGPSWWLVQRNYRVCRTEWWKNILFINNYVNSGQWCLLQTWYLAFDFQSYVLGLLIVYAFFRTSRKIGYSLLALVTFISVALPFYNTYMNDMDPFLLPLPDHRLLFESSYFMECYVITHLRFSPYVIGIITGAILYDCKNVKLKVPKVLGNILLIFLDFGVGLLTQIYGFKYFDPNIKTSTVERALYESLCHGVYALGFLSSIIMVTICQGFDIWFTIFAGKWMQPLSKLTYCVYLIHWTYFLFVTGSARKGEVCSFSGSFVQLVSDSVILFTMAFLIVVTVEEPFRKIGKLLLLGNPKGGKTTITDEKKEKKLN